VTEAVVDLHERVDVERLVGGQLGEAVVERAPVGQAAEMVVEGQRAKRSGQPRLLAPTRNSTGSPA
jgi:hypothetical protein